MANVLLAYPNLGDSSTLSGGGWQLPLTNLQDYRMTKVARSTDATLGNTQFSMNFGVPTKIQVVSLLGHNLSSFGTWRVLIGNDPTFTTNLYDSGWQVAWPVVYNYGSLEWEDSNWWDGTVAVADRANYPGILLDVLPQIYLAQYVQVLFSDVTNTTGYLQFGRFFCAPTWTPADNMQYGATFGWATDTTVGRSLGGTPYFARRNPRRVGKFTLAYLSDDEAKSKVFEIQRQLGLDGEMLVCWDPADGINLLRLSYAGRMSTLNPIATVFTNINSAAFEIEEIF